MAYQRKTYDEYELLGNYGFGYEYIIADRSLEVIKQYRKEYQENYKGTAYRIVKRRVPIDKQS